MPPDEPKVAPAKLNYRAPRADLRVYAPNHEFFPKWIIGVIVPIGVAIYGGVCIVKQVAEYGGEGHATMTVHGMNAVAVGTMFLAVALFMHCEFFWGAIYQSIWFAELGEIVAGLVFIISLVILIVRVGVYGIS
jgi:hypothetical protein